MSRFTIVPHHSRWADVPVIALGVALLVSVLGLGATTGFARDTPIRSDPDGSPRCDPLDPSVCMQPWPNNVFTRPDRGTQTGRRVALDASMMPRNLAGDPVDPTPYNRADGFSPGQTIVVHVEGMDNQAAFDRSGIVSLTDPRRYADPDQPVVVLDATTGQRWPIFAELDVRATDDADRQLLIHPLRNFHEGHRYVVLLRNLRRSDGKLVDAPEAFRVYRDRLPSLRPDIERRRAHFEREIFGAIRAVGSPRGSSNTGYSPAGTSFNSRGTSRWRVRRTSPATHSRCATTRSRGSATPTSTISRLRADHRISPSRR